MSFITKRERVFEEYDVFDLPPRNEGKLKAYASCTDARAWSHFCSSQSEHLAEMIRKNNDLSVAPKYVPTKVIVDTIMVSKNAEIASLRRKIEEFEQMLAVYEELDLDCDQKCEIAKAHAAIKAANKGLDDLCLDLNLSNFTEGSEGFMTGKSRRDETGKLRGDESDRSHGDEWSESATPFPDTVSVGNQIGLICPCDASVSAHDPRIEEMQDEIIHKDAKLSAMQNTIAVMENDVCEPYCIYAHIYTALEKIFAILSQNSKYKQYLNLMTAGKDTRCIDIKGKILFKMKVLEKFCLALIAPCSQNFNPTDPIKTAACFRAEVETRVEKAFALTSSESKPSDVKRSRLVADIMEHDEMKEIMSKDSILSKEENVQIDDVFFTTNYSIDAENQKRLKDLQANYEDLLHCYENLKFENDSLRIKFLKHEELEIELENLRSQLREYTSLWNEKEHYRKRSEDLDKLKEQYFILSDETSNLETKLKAESEINNIKANTIEELRGQNLLLEKKINEVYVNFEKDKIDLQHRLQESECKVMCQEEQIKSLSSHIVKLLEQETVQDKPLKNTSSTAILIDENIELKQQVKNLLDIEDEFQEKVALINELKVEIEEWKSSYEKTLERNKYLESCLEDYKQEYNKISREVEDKSSAMDKLSERLYSKSQEVNSLYTELEAKHDENQSLHQKLSQIQDTYENHISKLESEKNDTLSSLHLSRQESQELLKKVRNYDEVISKQDDMAKSIEEQMKQNDSLKNEFIHTIEENNRLKVELTSLKSKESELQQEIERSRNDITTLKEQLPELQRVSLEFHSLKSDHDSLNAENQRMKNELKEKESQLDSALFSLRLGKKQSTELLTQSEKIKDELFNLHLANKQLDTDKRLLEQSLQHLREENRELADKTAKLSTLEHEIANLKNIYEALLIENESLQNAVKSKNDEINNLWSTLEEKSKENKFYCDEINEASIRLKKLQSEKLEIVNSMEDLKKERGPLCDQLEKNKYIERDFKNLKQAFDNLVLENDSLQKALASQLEDLKRVENKKAALSDQVERLLSDNKDLEKTLLSTQNQLMSSISIAEQVPYSDLIQDIQDMKQTKLANNNKIRELRDKLEESENLISNLNEEVCAREDKMAIMQNHINELQDEVRRLHSTLEEAVDTGEQIKDNSAKNIDESMKTINAHHSRATHNMKMDLATVQNDNLKLKSQLEATTQKSDEYSRDQQKYRFQVERLQNEREIIVTDIKQLEIKTAGTSELMPNKCDIEDILNSLDEISKSFDTRQAKRMSLEQTILKVQSSSQLLLSKANEAKSLLEKEKQKIINEKEEAIRDRINIENQLIDLKDILRTQKSQDLAIIRDLEAEIQNQRLIIDKINMSTQSYKSKLEDEIKSWKDLYLKSTEKLSDLQNKLKLDVDDKENKAKVIETIRLDLEKKSKEVTELQAQLDRLKEIPKVHISTQTSSDNFHNTSSQTDDIKYDYNEIYNRKMSNKQINDQGSDEKSVLNLPEIDIVNKMKPIKESLDEPVSKLLPKQKPPSVNEVRILTANVEPTFDFVRNSYLNYKIKRLSPGKLEHCSIPFLGDSSDYTPDISDNITSSSMKYENETGKTDIEDQLLGTDFNDTYNQGSLSLSPDHFQDSEINEPIEIEQRSAKSSPIYKKLNLTNDGLATGSNIKYYGHSLDVSSSEKSIDKDIFLIYRESDSNVTDEHNDHGKLSTKQPNDSEVIDKWSNKKHDSNLEDTNNTEISVERDLKKPKLNIKLPRVREDSLSAITSDADKKSLDSYAAVASRKSDLFLDTKIDNDSVTQSSEIVLPSVITSNDVNKYFDYRNALRTRIDSNEIHITDPNSVETSKRPRSHNITSDINNESRHKLSRIGADAFLIKPEDTERNKTDDDKKKLDVENNSGLEFLSDTVKQEVDNISVPDYWVGKALHKSRSDERYNSSSFYGTNESSPLKISSFEYKSLSSSPSRCRLNNKSVTKSVERSIMAKLDSTEYYENQIENLNKSLGDVEEVYKKKISIIKMEYDRNVNSIINEHNHGVKNIQNLHEETLQDILKVHENEVENLRGMSIDAMRKADKLERENLLLKSQIKDFSSTGLDQEPIKISSPEVRKRKRNRVESKVLTKTDVEAFNVKPKARVQGPCSCSLDLNISDTIRNIFEQVDVEKRKCAELAYMKDIANKIANGNVEGLDAQELSFLHLKVCRTWKLKLSKEEALQKKIDSLEVELMNKQRNAQQHLADLDRKVAEERRRLEEVREAVCRTTPADERTSPLMEAATVEKDFCCGCSKSNLNLSERRSAGDIPPGLTPVGLRQKKTKTDSHRAVLARLDMDLRRERKPYNDEPPTRLRRPHDRLPVRPHKKNL